MPGDIFDGTAASDGDHCAPIIGYHRAPLSQKFGAPRQPNLVPLTSVIEMLPPYDTPAAFEGLETFSHIWVSWQFHHNYRKKDTNQTDSSFRAQVRPPRLGGNQKIGVFASRSMYRPSGLGLSVVTLDRIEIVEGRVLLVIKGADMIDGTPIIDIKPYVAYSDAITHGESGFAPTAPALLEVVMTTPAYEQFMTVVNARQTGEIDSNNCDNVNNHDDVDNQDASQTLKNATIVSSIHNVQSQLLISDMAIIQALIAQDPRPAYRRNEIDKSFVMRYKSIDVSFQLIDSGQLQITAVVAV
ncbi:tRNA (N6-threonylcarbamoyladenosine(37)-N6)-methyltransferase TrmO [Psychrobacter sp. SWN149]|uniref:tRNA (N6-threonylcarbamoyladenosine(37)-N6)-methyltransferase TrmO n=1 Tax=Psychrobacter sp. SWN149 TaxID=2792057 RepID=UPI0018CF7420|nr:tRNA (N6-threonylcarbamoyladenosine(37)-N6)-methyltransferase TrmO [Psychrobacter sp. SWN149]MBH0005855.1 tRNA (N6-threonylcarbamoyladenosine(37)-N6)-methyltransferase TrmO [Psychrobacter sp. SWN149]